MEARDTRRRRMLGVGGALATIAALTAVSVVSASAHPSSAAVPAAASASKGNLLWVQPLRNHPVHRLMQAGFLTECKRLGYHCGIVGNPSATTLDVPASLALADAALSREKFKAVGVYAFDPSMYPYIKKLAGRHLPVVSWHIYVKKGTVPGLTAITGCNPAAYARLAADAIGRKIGGNGTVAVTEGSLNTIENLVAKPFTAEMKAKSPSVKVLSPDTEGFEPSAATAKAVSILQAHPDVNAAFSTTGGGPQTWSAAARQASRK